MEEDIEMPLILGRPFLATDKASIDVQEGKLRLRVGEEEITFDVFNALKHTLHTDGCFRIDVVDSLVCNLVQDSMKDPLEATLTTEFKEDDLDEEKDEIVAHFNANNPWKKPMRIRLKDLGERKDLTPPKSTLIDAMEEKLLQVLKAHKKAFAWKVADIKGKCPSICMHKILMEEKYSPPVQPQRRLNPKMQEVVKAETIKPLDACIIYPISDSAWVSPIQCVPKKSRITVITNEKNELIPTRTVTGWRVCIDYRKLNDATHKDHFSLPFIDQMLERLAGQSELRVEKAYEELKERLVTAPVLVAPDWNLPFEVMCDASDIAVGDVLGQRHNKLFEVRHCPWYVNFANFLVTGTPPQNLSFHQRKKFFSDMRYYFWEEPFLFKICADSMIRSCVAEEEFGQILNHCHDREVSGNFGPTRTASKVLECGFYWPTLFKDARSYVLTCVKCQRTGNISNRHEMPLNNILECEVFDVWGIDFMGPFPSSFTKKYILVAVDYVFKWIEAEAYAINDAQVVLKFLKKSERRLLQLDQLEEFRNLAYDLALPYKEKTKRAHDRRIIRREFKEGDNVLLYNSQLRLFLGKLKSRWSGPFVISKVYPSGAVELQDGKDETFTVNAQRLKHCMGGTIEPQLGITRFHDNPN
ncbi:uncharacterized protein LOC142542054 [Primulina tabacum]|uniref:uncharacterized protein LOC142542054 n=1 Tax=Primulina tabacum TaxID=48773 RepID=UPI003F593679